jgi:5-methylcytosine-specific restriction enzyme subunit McrC
MAVEKVIYDLLEWQRVIINERFTSSDYVLAKQLSENDKLEIEELRSGTRIKANSWVGSVEFENFVIAIKPKLLGGENCLIEMLELCGGLGTARLLNSQRLIDTEKTTFLFDLFAQLLAEACTRLIRDGLLNDYVVREETLPALRGRLLADRQLLKHYGRVDKLECRYDEWETDTVENQLLALALSVTAPRVRDEQIKRRIRQLESEFLGVCNPVELNWRRAEATLTYSRMNAHYEPAHKIAFLILKGLGIKDLYSYHQQTVYAFLLDMNSLFETFCGIVLGKICQEHGWRYDSQAGKKSIIWNLTTNRSYAQVRPDYVITAPNEIGDLPIDAKYKLYDDQKVKNADIYQTFLYALSHQTVADSQQAEIIDNSKAKKLPKAILLYPANISGNEGKLEYEELQIRSLSEQPLGNIKIIGLPIPQLLSELRNPSLGNICRSLEDQLISD